MLSITRLVSLSLALLVVARCHAAPVVSPYEQQMIDLPVRVVDPEGNPVRGAVVVPWALRSSSGHGSWREDFGLGAPPRLVTDADGRALVPYPRFTNLDEGVATTEVTLSVDHGDFVYIVYEFINVPKLEALPHTVKLALGSSVEIIPMQDGVMTPCADVLAMWSDGRFWNARDVPKPVATHDGALRFPIMPSRANQVLLLKLEGDLATHFSAITEIDTTGKSHLRKEVELRPARRVVGQLGDDVPRPVKNGRLKAQTLPRSRADDGVDWFTWAPIDEDGAFVIDGWPVDESAQLIALCDGFIAESGAPPSGVTNVRSPDPFQRAQVFSAAELAQPITLRMTATANCEVEVVDAEGTSLSGINVKAYPNVQWWSGGSQIYCHPLARGERAMVERDYNACLDAAFPYPFEATTDAGGHARLQLPLVANALYAEGDAYELPIHVGRRQHAIRLSLSDENRIRLTLQRKGSEYLGEWDKLAGVLFGCTGEQCRRLLEDPVFREEMSEVRKRIDLAADPTAPDLLTGVYAAMADAFDALGDTEEVSKWRKKAAEQAEKIRASKMKSD